MRVAIVGGSVAGLVTGLLLARAGHEAIAFERDAPPGAPDVARVEDAASGAFRAGAPQIVQAHVFQPLLRTLLLDHLPDVHAALRAAGVVELTVSERMPHTITRRDPEPGDDLLTIMHMRRSSLDLALRSVAQRQRGLSIRYGVRVTGVLAEPGRPALVTGLRTSDGDVPADLVIDASGRRTGIDTWLAAIGAPRTAVEFRECGHSYYTRFLRRRRGAATSQQGGVAGGPMPYFTALLFLGDHDTVQLALAPLAEDAPLRALRDTGPFEAVARSITALAPWLDAADPISPIFPMAGLHNTYRRLIVDGRPVAHGLLAVGDSVCTTNPTFGRGVSLAVRNVVDTIEVIARHHPDLDSLVRAADARALCAAHPWYAQQAEIDERSLAERRALILGAEPPAPPAAPADGRIGLAALTRAARTDAAAFRARCRLQGMIERPDRLLAEPAVIDAVRSALAAAGPAPPPESGPGRDELLRLLGPGSTAGALGS